MVDLLELLANTPVTFIAWAMHLLALSGPILPLAAVFIVIIVLRPHVFKALPGAHRRATLQSSWTLRLAVGLILGDTVILPYALAGVNYITEDNLATDPLLMALIPGTLAIGVLVVYWVSNVFWFRNGGQEQKHDESHLISPALRRVVLTMTVSLAFISGCGIALGAGYYGNASSVSGIPASVIGFSLMAISGIVGPGALYVGLQTARRPAVPGLPLAFDVVLKRIDLDRMLRIINLTMGAAVAGGLQAICKIAIINDIPILISFFTIVLAWLYSLISVALTILPTSIILRVIDPSTIRMHAVHDLLIRGRYDTGLLTLESLPEEEDIRKAEVSKDDRGVKSLALNWSLQWIRADAAFAPGSGSTPEELSEAMLYASQQLVRGKVLLTEEYTQDLDLFMSRCQELSEYRATVHEGATGILVDEQDEEALKSMDIRQERLSKDPRMAILTQSLAPVMVGLDEETKAAWDEHEAYMADVEEFSSEVSSPWPPGVAGTGAGIAGAAGEVGGYQLVDMAPPPGFDPLAPLAAPVAFDQLATQADFSDPLAAPAPGFPPSYLPGYPPEYLPEYASGHPAEYPAAPQSPYQAGEAGNGPAGFEMSPAPGNGGEAYPGFYPENYPEGYPYQAYPGGWDPYAYPESGEAGFTQDPEQPAPAEQPGQLGQPGPEYYPYPPEYAQNYVWPAEPWQPGENPNEPASRNTPA